MRKISLELPSNLSNKLKNGGHLILRKEDMYTDRHIPVIENLGYRDGFSFEQNPSPNKLYMGIELEFDQGRITGADLGCIPEMFRWSTVKYLRMSLSKVLIEGHHYAYLCPDGSLFRGIELVTGPYTFSYHRKWINTYGERLSKAALQALARPDGKQRTCGMHIHLTRGAFTSVHLGKFCSFVNASANSSFMDIVSHRKLSNNRWASTQRDHKFLRKTSVGSYQNYRYVAINLQNSQTVELRIFRGSTKHGRWLEALEFAKALFDFTAICSIQEVFSTDAFVFYVRERQKEFPVLWELVRAKILKQRKPRAKRKPVTELRLAA